MWQSRLLSIAIPLLLRTLRLRVINAEPLQQLVAGKKPFVILFWHGSMLLPWWFMRKSRPAALISKSKDGQILSEILDGWKYNVVRGSSSKGSKEAMDMMRRLIEYGYAVCITPDGPRGPRMELKMGGIRLAQTKEVPLLYCSVRFDRFSSLKSWDAFEIPHLFTRACISFSDPIAVPVELEGEALDDFRSRIQIDMQAAHDSCLRHIQAVAGEPA
jgi:lysophospholipid acyltransferase (LPLAT)-like uncharacterized protein